MMIVMMMMMEEEDFQIKQFYVGPQGALSTAFDSHAFAFLQVFGLLVQFVSSSNNFFTNKKFFHPIFMSNGICCQLQNTLFSSEITFTRIHPHLGGKHDSSTGKP